MKLSVYIPTLKRDELFERCLASIRHSITPSCVEGLDYEIIVVEGVTPVSEARNVGMRRAKGEWIAAVDADDTVAADWFPEIWRAIQKAEALGTVDDIIFDYLYIRPNCQWVNAYGRASVLDAKILRNDLLRDIRIGNFLWQHVMRRTLLEDFTFARTPFLEDYLSLPKILTWARQVLYVPKPLYHHIHRNESLVSSADSMTVFDLAVKRAKEYGGPAVMGASKMAYDRMMERTDENGRCRLWLLRHLRQILTDFGLDWKWRLKLAAAAFGIVRRPSRTSAAK